MSIDLDAIEDRHIAALSVSPVSGSLVKHLDALRASAADVSDLIAEVRRLQPLARKWERLQETHAIVEGVSLG